MSEDSETTAGDYLHWLTIAGIWTLLGAIALIVWALMLPTSLPEPPSLPDLPSYDDQLESVKNQIILRAGLWWLADHLLRAGFLLWLSGIVLKEMRRSR